MGYSFKRLSLRTTALAIECKDRGKGVLVREGGLGTEEETCLGVTEFVVVFIQLDGGHHLFSGNFGVNKTFGNCGRSKDSVSVRNLWMGYND